MKDSNNDPFMYNDTIQRILHLKNNFQRLPQHYKGKVTNLSEGFCLYLYCTDKETETLNMKTLTLKLSKITKLLSSMVRIIIQT